MWTYIKQFTHDMHVCMCMLYVYLQTKSYVRYISVPNFTWYQVGWQWALKIVVNFWQWQCFRTPNLVLLVLLISDKSVYPSCCYYRPNNSRRMAVGWSYMTYLHAKLCKNQTAFSKRWESKERKRHHCDCIHLPSPLKLSSLFMK